MIKIKALIVDDCRVMRAMVMHALNRVPGYQFEFVEAGDGRAALETLELKPVDIVLTDRNMPELGGLDLMRRVRATPYWKSIRLAMVSCENRLDQIDEALQAGADAYVCKPFTVEDVDHKIGPLLKAITSLKRPSSLLRSIFG